MPTYSDFATRHRAVAETPDPFRPALENELQPDESAQLLVHCPGFSAVSSKSPETLLAVTDQRWIILLKEGDGRLHLAQSVYADTLLLELTEILLYGQLKIDFISAGHPEAVSIEFNAVSRKEYRLAARLILDGSENASKPELAAPGRIDDQDWPIKFRNLYPEYLPPGQALLEAAFWPTVTSGFKRELAPAAVLLLTERELVLFSEQRSPTWSIHRHQTKYGSVVTYFPLSRLASYTMTPLKEGDRLGILNLQMHACHGGDELQILFAAGHSEEIEHLMRRARKGFTA